MNDIDRRAHWQNADATKGREGSKLVSESPAPSLDLVAATGLGSDVDIIDAGGGASRLVDSLLERGFRRVAVLDLSANALEEAKKRLGRRADGFDWIAADVTTLEASRMYDLWHDRAASISSQRPLTAMYTRPA